MLEGPRRRAILDHASNRLSKPVKPQPLRRLSDTGAEGQRVYLGVQILRGVAALLVVVHHDSVYMAQRAHDSRLAFDAG
jgi:hypothetical protein